MVSDNSGGRYSRSLLPFLDRSRTIVLFVHLYFDGLRDER